MKFMRIPLIAFLFVLFAASLSTAQKAEVTISLNEQFFDALLDGVFQHGGAPEFSIAQSDTHRRDAETQRYFYQRTSYTGTNLNNESIGQVFSASQHFGGGNKCDETIKLLRETGGVRTAVRFREGKILAPLAFSGNYNPPFIGCVPFGGLAESVIDLEFDRNSQRLTARAKVLNVSLSGTGGIGGSVIARLVQGSIDKKINPIEIMKLDSISFAVPIQNSAALKMKAVGFRHSVDNGVMNVHIAYEFLKN